MSDLIDRWLESKYTGGEPDGARFRDERGEYHASNISNCPRRWYWDFERESEDSWSPYFELGRVFEDVYGRALRWEHGDDRVKQDVNIEIRIDDDTRIVGESDWTVFKESARYEIDKVTLRRDGTRDAVTHAGDVVEYGRDVLKVVETKTTKDIDWRRRYGHKPSHLYQLQTYMWAMDCPGEIAYMTRNELDEMVFDFERDGQVEQDIEIRTTRHHANLLDDEPPDTDPVTDRRCKYCEWRSECESLGGSRWE